MPDVGTQVEIKDTHRKVYTQCGGSGGVIASTIVEHKKLQEMNTHPGTLSNLKRKQPRKPGMKASEVNTENRIKTHRKCVGTDDVVMETNEKPEIIILKEINNLKCNRVQSEAAPSVERKRTWRQANPSCQEKLYADILAGDVKREGGKRRKREQRQETQQMTGKEQGEKEN